MQTYNIAFMASPDSTFIEALRNLAQQDGVDIRGMIIDTGPGATNLGVLLDEPNDEFIHALTMALMPARYCAINPDPRLTVGVFKDLRQKQ